VLWLAGGPWPPVVRILAAATRQHSQKTYPSGQIVTVAGGQQAAGSRTLIRISAAPYQRGAS
jgi:hypothetical protein